jgi:hypothetical protein
MILKKIALLVFGAATAAALLSGSATLPSSQTGTAPTAASGECADLHAIYFDVGRAGARAFALVPENSQVRIYALRAGRGGGLGHDHVISASQFTGFFYLPPGGPANGRFDLVANDVQTDRFPLVRSRLLQISAEVPEFAAKAHVQTHGLERDIWIPLDVEGLSERLSVTGSFVLRQSDLGVSPYSLLGGLLSVPDEVVLDFKMTGACRLDTAGNC